MISELGRRTEQRSLPPHHEAAMPAKTPQMPEELLARYGLIWLDEANPLASEKH